MSIKQKYVRLKKYDEIIIFPEIIEHLRFRTMNPVSAGFCSITENKVTCWGNSFSLGLDSDPKDSYLATKQLYGWEAAEELL